MKRQSKIVVCSLGNPLIEVIHLKNEERERLKNANRRRIRNKD